MIGIKCHQIQHECPKKLDICCQFCEMNYSPCDGKCSGCWDTDQLSGLPALQPDTIKSLVPKLPVSVA